jgi:hypothetical protein
MPEQKERPQETVPWSPKSGDSGGPVTPNISKPDTKNLLEKLRRVGPDSARKYQQRSGQ